MPPNTLYYRREENNTTPAPGCDNNIQDTTRTTHTAVCTTIRRDTSHLTGSLHGKGRSRLSRLQRTMGNGHVKQKRSLPPRPDSGDGILHGKTYDAIHSHPDRQKNLGSDNFGHYRHIRPGRHSHSLRRGAIGRTPRRARNTPPRGQGNIAVHGGRSGTPSRFHIR